MQALRQCSACASRAAGGHLLFHKDASLLQKNKSGLRRACIRLLSNSESVLLRGRKPGSQKPGDWTDAAHMNRASLSVGSAHAFPFAQQVSHDSLIRRAASMVTDSSSMFLSQSTLALTDALREYSKAVYTRINVQKRYLASLGKLTPAELDSLLEAINYQRAQVSERLDECRFFESTWINAVNLCKMAAETAHSTGAEQASITARTNIQVAQSHVEESQKLSAEADKKLAETKVEEIQRMAEYAAFQEDSELHEAYLRED